MDARGRRLSWWMAGIAAAGVLVTHWLTYRLAVPHAHDRVHVLHESGHAHWPVVSAVGLALFTAASLRLCVLGLRGGRVAGFRTTAVHLATLQAVAWTVLEVGERVAAGRVVTLDDHAVLLTGLGVQVAVAVLGAVVVRVAVRVLSGFAARPTVPRLRPQSVAMPASFRGPSRVLPLAGAHGLRGPPLPRPTS
jgi:hypothetical protein